MIYKETNLTSRVIAMNNLANGGAVSFTTEETKDVPASSPANQLGNHLHDGKAVQKEST